MSAHLISLINVQNSSKGRVIYNVTIDPSAQADEILAFALIDMAKKHDVEVHGVCKGYQIEATSQCTPAEVLENYNIRIEMREMSAKASYDHVQSEISELETIRDCQEELLTQFDMIENLVTTRNWLEWFYNVYKIMDKSPKPLVFSTTLLNKKMRLLHDKEDATANTLIVRLKDQVKSGNLALMTINWGADIGTYLKEHHE
ncbi:hypothetical protein [Ewingella americana]|uniref:Uncharacterized protein n=1 Tax=Ewingella americana TaxID=41202 RepID=A0A502GDT4_9GAMM|nr:hypothetical protein [Ewingella americana]TPG60024.1 hypothetical protein EAH77_15770 [Ewingella americana]